MRRTTLVSILVICAAAIGAAQDTNIIVPPPLQSVPTRYLTVRFSFGDSEGAA